MKKTAYSIVFGIILILGCVQFAAAIPTENVDQEQANCADAFYATSYSGHLAQSFKPTLNMLTTVKLYGWRNETPPNALNISIRDSLNGPALTSTIVQPSNISEYTPSWFTVDLPDIKITPEETYFIVWSPTAGDSNEPYFWLGYDKANPGGDPYDRGSQYIRGEAQERADFTFQTYGYGMPSISISSPSNQQVVGGIITIQGSASDIDGSIQQVQLKINDGAWMTATGTNNWQYQWDSRTVENGQYLISARSFDGESYSEIQIISITIENTVLDITDIKSVSSLILATIENTGSNTAQNIQWSIQVQGGLFNMIDVEKSGSIASLAAGESSTITTDESISGIGFADIAITVSGDNTYIQTETVTALVIGPFILLI